MTLDWIIRIVLFGLVHWILAGILLQDLASRKKVFGGRKAPWVIIVLVIPCFGSILYLLFHPQILAPRDENPPRD
jgi:hypothetical protein